MHGFRRLFDEKLKVGEILLQEDRATNVHESPSQINLGKRSCDDGLPPEAEAEKVTPEGEPDPDMMAQ